VLSGRRSVAVLLGVILAAGVVACGSSGSGRPTNRSRANDLLARLTLPGDAVQRDTEPEGDGGVLASQSISTATPNVSRAHVWWVVAGDPQTVSDQIAAAAQRDLGATPGSTGQQWGIAIPQNRSDLFDLPPLPDAPGARQLVVTTVRLADGSTGIRIDAALGGPTSRNDDNSSGAVGYAPLKRP
jgi:hypothetical protein